MEEDEKISLEMSNNLNYALSNLKQAIEEINVLEDKTYFELTKQQIIDYLNYVYANIKDWKKSYETKNYKIITDKYKEIESIISQLEFCLVEFDNKFHIEGISYSIFQIGKIISNLEKESDKNGR
ncbi:MAG: hypothetical protein ACI33S_06850 [Bacilli bacterium]